MAERRDELLAVVALTLVTLLFAGQGVLAVLVTIAPLAYQAYSLTAEDDSAVANAGPPAAARWIWLSPLMVGGSLATGVWALLRLQRGTSVRGRWLWVLVMAGVSSGVGLLVWRLLVTLAT